MPISSRLDSYEEEQHQEYHRDHADPTGAAEGGQIEGHPVTKTLHREAAPSAENYKIRVKKARIQQTHLTTVETKVILHHHTKSINLSSFNFPVG